MNYIIPKSINTENIRFKKIKLKNNREYIDKIYYLYNSIELIGVPFKINKNDYEQYNEKIVLKNKKDIVVVNNLNNYILKEYPECLPIIYKDTILHSQFLETKNNDLYLFFSSLNTYKNCKKAKVYFIYD
tara:strand:+ start:529 stop:918 length:390 start_codon:yes stop_codon:yes gene_type:complete